MVLRCNWPQSFKSYQRSEWEIFSLKYKVDRSPVWWWSIWNQMIGRYVRPAYGLAGQISKKAIFFTFPQTVNVLIGVGYSHILGRIVLYPGLNKGLFCHTVRFGHMWLTITCFQIHPFFVKNNQKPSSQATHDALLRLNNNLYQTKPLIDQIAFVRKELNV